MRFGGVPKHFYIKSGKDIPLVFISLPPDFLVFKHIAADQMNYFSSTLMDHIESLFITTGEPNTDVDKMWYHAAESILDIHPSRLPSLSVQPSFI